MRLPLQWKVLIGYLVIAGVGMGTAGWLALDGLVLAAALGGAFLLSLGLSYVVARSVTHPLGEMVAAARRMARGEFREKIRTHSNDEIADLAAVLNQMAAAIEETIQTLKDDRAKMAATLTAMQEGVLVLASDGTVRVINPAMERMVGRRDTAVLGRTYLEVIRQPRLNEFITEVLALSTTSSTEITVGAGPEWTFQVQASPLAQGAGQSPGLVLVFHDITELRRMEQVRKDFVANVSHELRTPLTAIKGYIEALQDGAIEDREQRDRFLETLRKQTDRLDLIITDLLLLAKIESGQVPLKQEPVVLASLIDRTVGLLRHLIEQKRQQVVMKIPPELPPILGDEERLGQVFSNLLDNAIKYTPEQGTITISAELSKAAPPPAMIDVSVADTGIGIPPQDLPRIFERFYRVDKARSRELGGTGLGLSIVKHLVEGHGGTITVESLPNRGTKFCVRLPMAAAPALPNRT